MSTADNANWIVNTSDAKFETDVLERSRIGLVVVDFWAEWCAPCRALAPTLEKLATEFAGEFTLVKANTEENQQAAAQFRVSGIPAVFAVLDGEIVDAFQGAMPEDAIRSWIRGQFDKRLIVAARSELESNPVAAELLIRQAIEKSPNDTELEILLAEALLNQDRSEDCAAILTKLAQRGFLEPSAERLKAKLELKSKSGLSVTDARQAVEADPKNFALQFALAEALIGSQDYEAGFEICLTLVANDRKKTGELSRQLMVDVFRTLPEDSPLISDYRRKLSMAMY